MSSHGRAAPTLLTSLAALLLGGVAPAVADDWSSSDIKRAMRSGERDRVTAMFADLRGALEDGHVRAILDAAPRVKTLGVYDELVGLLRTARGEALEELLDQADRAREDDVRFLAVDAIGPIADSGVEPVLVERVEDDDDETVAVQAVRHLGRRDTATAVEALIELLEEFEDEGDRVRLVREINGALANLTGQDLTVAQDWENYWSAHEDEFSGGGPPAPDDGSSHTRDENAMDRLRRERPGDARTMERLRDDEVVVIRGRSDRVEDVLDALEVPYQLHDRSEFDSVELDPEEQVLVLNCAGTEDLTEDGVRTVRAFVAAGGYLFTSDWELRNTLEKAFPEVVSFLGETPNEDQTATIRPNREVTNHPLMRDVFPLSTWTERSFTWHLDRRSHLVKPNPAITVLVTCPETEEYGSTAMAFTFGFTDERGGRPTRPMTGGGRRRGRGPTGGRVLHVSSHFKNQRDASGDGFALQQLLLNFIVEKQEQRRAAAAGR